MIDDDSVPRPEWSKRVVEHFEADPMLGALSGRDQCYADGIPIPASEKLVGKMLWYGKHIGNHHLGVVGGPVDLIKGVNMNFRRLSTTDLWFDERLRPSGGAEDLSFARRMADAGLKMICDPEVIVDHYEAKDHLRHYGTLQVKNLQGLEDYNYNCVLATWPSLSFVGRIASFLYFVCVGTRVSPGLVQALRFTPSLGPGAWKRFMRTQKGRWQGMLDWQP
jgi:hypothetical protein